MEEVSISLALDNISRAQALLPLLLLSSDSVGFEGIGDVSHAFLYHGGCC